MVLVYFFTVLIVSLWLIRMIVEKRFIFEKTFLFWSLLFFLISQILSTFFSIDPHTSIFGYYSRFHGGLLSTISYLLLFWALVSNGKKEWVGKIVKISFVSAFLVASYGVAEHFGIDKNFWVQDVKRRVFSTFGQPNWLAAFLDVLLMILLSWQFLLAKPRFSLAFWGVKKPRSSMLWRALDSHKVFFFLFFLFYLCLLYTKSRSGFLAFWGSFLIFIFLLVYSGVEKIRAVFKKLWQPACLAVLLSLLVWNPFFPTLPQLWKRTRVDLQERGLGKEQNPQNLNITPSSQIRKIVWRGALRLWQKYPVLGTGVETFAYSYYWVRPVEHNLTSEWDFLYNKAHNEYLNFAATSGTVGLLAYLSIPVIFLGWSLKKFKNQNSKLKVEKVCLAGLVAAMVSVLITNFFGFSVVGVALWFFLLPALAFLLFELSEEGTKKIGEPSPIQVGGIMVVGIVAVYFFYLVASYWLADFYFAKADRLRKMGDYPGSLRYFQKAIKKNPREAVFWGRFSLLLAELAVLSYRADNQRQAEKFVAQAVEFSDKAVRAAPFHLNIYKERARMFYILSQIDIEYLKSSLDSLLAATRLAPTDPKLYYNAGLILDALGKEKEAVEFLKEALRLKPNYDKAEVWLKKQKD